MKTLYDMKQKQRGECLMKKTRGKNNHETLPLSDPQFCTIIVLQDLQKSETSFDILQKSSLVTKCFLRVSRNSGENFAS